MWRNSPSRGDVKISPEFSVLLPPDIFTDERFCRHRFRDCQLRTHEHLLGGACGGARGRGDAPGASAGVPRARLLCAPFFGGDSRYLPRRYLPCSQLRAGVARGVAAGRGAAAGGAQQGCRRTGAAGDLPHVWHRLCVWQFPLHPHAGAAGDSAHGHRELSAAHGVCLSGYPLRPPSQRVGRCRGLCPHCHAVVAGRRRTAAPSVVVGPFAPFEAQSIDFPLSHPYGSNTSLMARCRVSLSMSPAAIWGWSFMGQKRRVGMLCTPKMAANCGSLSTSIL